MELTSKKIVRYTTLGLALLLIAVLLFGSFSNSEVVTAVRIKLKAGQTEPKDKTFAMIGFGKEHSLPDYRVKLAVQGAFLKIDLGTKTDTSAAGGLEFPVQEVVPVRKLQEIVILECDTVEDDELERFQPGTSRVLSGKVYDCEVVTARSLDAGLDWFFNTSLGRTIASVCVLALLLFLVMLFSK